MTDISQAPASQRLTAPLGSSDSPVVPRDDVLYVLVNDALLRRAVNRIAAGLLLILLIPVLAAIVLAIMTTSRGPVIFRQVRVGRGGTTFVMLKFRSMVSNAERRLEENAELRVLFEQNSFKVPANQDPRVTRIGRWLRASSLDELPQLWNVVRGDMSLVGPRPVEPAEFEAFGHHRAIYAQVLPGMTGYWQVNGRSSVGGPGRAKLDAFYVANRSLRLDLLILLKTIPAVLLRRGAH